LSMDIMTLLETIRDKLATVPGVKTCKIGLEANMSPDAYPMVRLVPSTVRNGSVSSRQCELTIYFGQPIHEFTDGLESLYGSLFALEVLLLEAVRSIGLNMRYEETVMDEDRVESYKLMAIRVVVQG